MRPGKPYPATFRMSVDRPGIEPGFPPRQGGVVPLDHQPVFSGPDRSRTDHTDLARISRPHRHAGPLFREVRPGIEPGLRAPTTLTDHSSKVIPGRIELPISWVSSRRLRHWTTGSCSVTRVGIEPTKSQVLGLLALPVCVPGHVQVAGPGVAHRQSRPMRPE